jgi:alpha-ketoglutarate-dependent taurine dioxygenase
LSRIASSVTIFNELWKQSPSIASRLFEAVRHDRRNEEKPGQPPYALIQPACFDGARLRTFYHSDYFRSVVRHVGALDPDERELFDAYEAIAERDDIRLDMRFEPGDIQLLSNHTIVHARTAYSDGDRKRHLLRLWLTL